MLVVHAGQFQGQPVIQGAIAAVGAGQGRCEIVPFAGERPTGLVGEHLATGEFREAAQPVEGPPPYGVQLARHDQTLHGAGANGVQLPEARGVCVARQPYDQRLGLKSAQDAENLAWGDAAAGADCLGGARVESSDEHREAPENRLFRRLEQPMAPVDRGGQPVVTTGTGPASVGQKRQLEQPVVQSGEDVAQGERADAVRREFDAERQTVQPTAYLGNGRSVATPEGEAGHTTGGAFDEQADGVRAQEGGRVVTGAGRRQRQLADPEHGLSGNPQRLPAGGKDPQPGAVTQQGRGQLSARLCQMFAVVQDDKPGGVADRTDQGVGAGSPRSLAHAQRGGHGLRERSVVVQRVEFDQVNPRVAPRQPFGELQRQPRLADASGSGQREQARCPQQGAQDGEFLASPHEGVERSRQPATRIRRGGIR
ncbi:hypothetical protein [Streptomyces mirabilis]|uniref:hypothetical protein n=1 Tax=Streptomyces mirabilis TaxID=68239 RepID=UPI003685164E